MPGSTAVRYATNTATTSNSITSAAVWRGWNAYYSVSNVILMGSSCTPSTDSGLVWSSWCRISAGTASAGIVQTWDNHRVWGAWNQGRQPTPARMHGFSAPAVHRELTPEERAAREAERIRWEEQRKVEDAERERARENAKKLLLSILNEDQKKDWVAHGHFFLHVGDRKYRIKRGRSGNVELVDPKTHEILERYCAHPVQNVPDEDTAVAQMMYLLHDEQRFIGLANVHYTKPGFQSQKRRLAAA